jgi:hypothetical protein
MLFYLENELLNAKSCFRLHNSLDGITSVGATGSDNTASLAS